MSFYYLYIFTDNWDIKSQINSTIQLKLIMIEIFYIPIYKYVLFYTPKFKPRMK